jgi:hypothetical protein
MSKKTDKLNEAALMRDANKKQQEKLYKTIKAAGGDIGMRVRKDEKTKEDKMPNAIYMDNPWGSNRHIDTYAKFQVRESLDYEDNDYEDFDIDGFNMNDLYNLGAELIIKAADILSEEGTEEHDIISSEDPSEVIDRLEKDGSEEAKVLIDEIKDVENKISELQDIIDNAQDEEVFESGLPTAKGAKQFKDFMKKAAPKGKKKKKGKKSAADKGVKDLTGAKISTYESWASAFKDMHNPKRLEDFYMWLDRDQIDLNDDSWVRGTKEDFVRPMFKNLPNHKDRFPYDVLRDGKFLETKDGKIVAQINKLKGKVIVLDIIDENNEHQYVEFDLVKIVKKIKDKELKINSNETSKEVKIDTPWGTKFKIKENE